MEQQQLQLLIFTLGKSRYGIDIEQIAALTAVDTNSSAVSLAMLLGSTISADNSYVKQLLIKQKLQTPIRITEPDEVASFPISAIRTLPDILTVPASSKGVWGLLPQEHAIIILLDLYKNQQFQQLAKINAVVHSSKQEGYNEH